MLNNLILKGVVGSRAYGLDHENSDTDYKGVFIAPLEEVLSLRPVKDSYVFTEPHDEVYYELKKFMTLAASGNPTILELLFLNKYKVLSEEGRVLLENRNLFLSQRIRTTYIGYAKQQFAKRESRDDASFSSTLRERTSKHTRHLFRILEQGEHLLRHGEIQVKVRDRNEIFRLGELPLEEVSKYLDEKVSVLDALETSLPKQPDYSKLSKLYYNLQVKK